jgi:uncharacterized membrane protein YcaP (DUF421 family)
MEVITEIFGTGKNLTTLQMCCRGVVMFFIMLFLIRLSGRRSFGIKTSFDNIVVISLGAILSRAVVGVSPFIPVVACSTVIVLLHRLFGWLIVHHHRLARWIEGEKLLLYKDGKFLKRNMEKALVCKEDIIQGIRESALTEDVNDIDRIYLERNGVVSVIKKKTAPQ